MQKLLLKFQITVRKTPVPGPRLKLHAATIFIKKDTLVRCFLWNDEKHLTPILQSLWINNFAWHYSEVAVRRFSSK